MTKKTGKLIILRHGLTDYNAKKQMTGQKDIPLLPEGEQQAKSSGALLNDTHIDKVYASPLERAYKTAELILDNMDDDATAHLKGKDGAWDIQAEYDLMEQDTGDFTGRNYQTDPEIIKFDRRFADAFPGGESTKDVLDRLTEFYEREVKQDLADGKTVMIACHSNVVRAFKVLFDETNVKEFHKHKAKVKNAAPWVLEFDADSLKKLKSYMFEAPAKETQKKAPRGPASKFKR